MNHREKEKLFKTLFDAYYERLYYAAATILGDQMVAEDIIEDVFEHYWERINDDAISNSPSYAYFLRMVYNRCGDHVRPTTDFATTISHIIQKVRCTTTNFLKRELR